MFYRKRETGFFTCLSVVFVFLVSLTFGFCAKASDAQYDWTKVVGGSEYDYANSVTTDTSGNMYVTGYFQGTVDFDPSAGTDAHTSAGQTDIFLSKYDSAGTYQWTKTVGGIGTEEATSVTTDTIGNVYIAGYFSSTVVDFDPGAGTDNHTNAGSVTSFSANTTLWAPTSGRRQWVE